MEKTQNKNNLNNLKLNRTETEIFVLNSEGIFLQSFIIFTKEKMEKKYHFSFPQNCRKNVICIVEK